MGLWMSICCVPKSAQESKLEIYVYILKLRTSCKTRDQIFVDILKASKTVPSTWRNILFQNIGFYAFLKYVTICKHNWKRPSKMPCSFTGNQLMALEDYSAHYHTDDLKRYIVCNDIVQYE
jgi:hypothetical protein